MDFHSAAARGLRRYVRLVTAALGPDVDCTAVHWDRPRRVAPTTWPSASPATPHRAAPAAVPAAGFTSTV